MTLLQSEMPSHSHALQASSSPANRTSPAGNSPARVSGALPYGPAGATTTTLADQALTPAGGDQPHNNMQPYLTFYFNIALQGVFPPRT